MSLAHARLVGMLATRNPDAARTFFRDVLGLALRHEDQFALSFDANGVTLRVTKAPPFTPHAFTSLGWNVADVRADVSALQAKGVVFERFDGMAQDELGVWVPPGAPSGAGVAWFKDPDGNLLSISGSS